MGYNDPHWRVAAVSLEQVKERDEPGVATVGNPGEVALPVGVGQVVQQNDQAVVNHGPLADLRRAFAIVLGQGQPIWR